MVKPLSEWSIRRRSHLIGAMAAMLILLIIVVVFESFLLYEQRTAVHATETQSDKLLTTFLEGDTTKASGASGVPIRMQNVRFKWSDKVYIDTGNIAVRAVPIHGSIVNFDDLSSFHLTMQQSVVQIRPEVLEGMFNESVFNYPESKLRTLKVALTESDKQRVVRVKGSVNLGVWISFEMTTHLSVDTKTNTLVLDVDHLKVLGVLPVSKLIKWKPFRLENIISLPPNKSLIVDGNRMMVKPFGLFPPPRVDGTMSSVTVDDKEIRLAFAGRPIPAPESSAKNYVYLKGGTSQFGNFRMLNTDILILDQDPADPFVFSLVHYADMVPRSKIEVHDTKSARVTMPDF
ncbi:MAG TPA: hypothetical protein VK527_11130 [Candidatus Limnocylindrales bacterium]|nr:hypothetical protein [Candidatus Limnocylindrales bacterium]